VLEPWALPYTRPYSILCRSYSPRLDLAWRRLDWAPRDDSTLLDLDSTSSTLDLKLFPFARVLVVFLHLLLFLHHHAPHHPSPASSPPSPPARLMDRHRATRLGVPSLLRLSS
jgi:hypothetical protein